MLVRAAAGPHTVLATYHLHHRLLLLIHSRHLIPGTSQAAHWRRRSRDVHGVRCEASRKVRVGVAIDDRVIKAEL